MAREIESEREEDVEVRVQRQSDGNEEEEDKDEDKECAVGVNEQGINGGETAMKEGGGFSREGVRGCWLGACGPRNFVWV